MRLERAAYARIAQLLLVAQIETEQAQRNRGTIKIVLKKSAHWRTSLARDSETSGNAASAGELASGMRGRYRPTREAGQGSRPNSLLSRVLAGRYRALFHGWRLP